MATKDYKLVREWCRFIGSYEYYANDQVRRAKETDAPENALSEIHENGCPTGRWNTLDDLPAEHTFRNQPGVR